ncbi:MAG: LysM peptidoglycan-binding domain-containing protein [Thermodesulfobacteriota bacterium]|nr:MAG: LysM peptidoglycan-binding domain-containing protein [Candidatus Dadabacteria bacterium]
MRNFFVNFFIFFLFTSTGFSSVFIESKASNYKSAQFKDKKIKKYITYFSKAEKGRVFFKQTYRRQGYFENTVHEIFAKYDIPRDLKYISMIESGFQFEIKSSAGAVGLWQFMPSTARIFGLRVDEWVDERRDFYKATQAAAEYLVSLKRKFGNWELVLAGYNSGDLTVKKAIEEHNSKDFWYLSQLTFPKQTKEYVPQILAVIRISKDLKAYGFNDLKVKSIIKTEFIDLPPQTRLDYIAKIAEIDFGLLKELNLALLRDITPPNEFYSARIPSGLKKKIYSKLKSNPDTRTIYKHKIKKGETLSSIAKTFSNSVKELMKLNNLSSSDIYQGDYLLVYKKTIRKNDYSNRAFFVYLVKEGDSLSKIAEKFNMRIKEIKNFNNLKSNRISVGQTLKIFKSNE